MEKEEIIQKLKRIREAHFSVQKIKKKISNAKAPDNYERKVKVPVQPIKPTVVNKPVYEPMTDKQFRYKNVYYFSRLPKGFGIAAIVQFFIFLALKSGVKNDGSDSDRIQIGITNFGKISLFILIGITALFLVLNILKYVKCNAKYKSYLEDEKAVYEQKKRKYAEYTEKYNAYLEEMNTYNGYVEEARKEENEIAELLKNDLDTIINQIKKDELMPALKKLEEENGNFINPEYYADLSVIIDFIEKGRADTLKEALNLLEEKKLREEKMERERLEREEEIERREREREEDIEREKRYREEDIRREERNRREAQRRQEEQRQEEERRREAEERKKHADAIAQCSMCSLVHNCSNYAKYPNCPNFRHR